MALLKMDAKIMNEIEEKMWKGDLEVAISLFKYTKYFKILLAIVILYAYYNDLPWLMDIVVLAVISAIILPLSFFDVFIQKLLEYNTRKLESRQLLNAQEANKHFDDLYRKLGQRNKLNKN